MIAVLVVVGLLAGLTLAVMLIGACVICAGVRYEVD